jgi:hypothetical protein
VQQVMNDGQQLKSEHRSEEKQHELSFTINGDRGYQIQRLRMQQLSDSEYLGSVNCKQLNLSPGMSSQAGRIFKAGIQREQQHTFKERSCEHLWNKL